MCWKTRLAGWYLHGTRTFKCRSPASMTWQATTAISTPVLQDHIYLQYIITAIPRQSLPAFQTKQSFIFWRGYTPNLFCWPWCKLTAIYLLHWKGKGIAVSLRIGSCVPWKRWIWLFLLRKFPRILVLPQCLLIVLMMTLTPSPLFSLFFVT